MSWPDWATIASAVIAFLSMVGAIVGWFLARKEKSAAADHERRALKAAEAAAGHEGRAADAAERSATAAESQERRDAEALSAIESDPWVLQSIPGENCWLINRSQTPKYGVEVGGRKVHDSPIKVGNIGAGKRKEIGILRIYSDQNDIFIRWHNLEDQSDGWLNCTEQLPPKIG